MADLLAEHVLPAWAVAHPLGGRDRRKTCEVDVGHDLGDGVAAIGVSPVQIGVAQAPEQGLQLAEDLPRRLDRHRLGHSGHSRQVRRWWAALDLNQRPLRCQ